MTQASCDCVVVGAGLTGAVAAVALAREGLDVAVIERRSMTAPAPGARPDMRALVIAAASQRILSTCGLWPRLEAHANPIREIHVTERGTPGSVRLSAAEAGLDALGWACPADVLLRELSQAACDAVGDAVFEATEFIGRSARDDGVRVRGRRGTVPVDVDARLLIGADGSASAVRSALGVAVDEFDYRQQAIVANVEAERPRTATAFERFTRRGPIAMIPLDGARYVSVQCLDDEAAARALALDDDAYVAMLQARFGDRLGQLGCPGPRRAHALVCRRARALAADRAVLIGNAANTMHPNAAQGWNLGLRDVAALAAAVRGTTDPGAHAVTDGYAAARRADHRTTVHATDLLAQAYVSQLCSVTAARRAAMWLTAGLAPLRRRLVARASGLAPLARGA